jgi:polar amino acid transport system substrate-binding protein
VGLAFIGAESYAQGSLLPNLPSDPQIERVAILTQTGTTSRRVAERFGFQSCTESEADIFGNDRVNTVFIASRHDSHAAYVLKALQAGKHVFVEKPLCLTEPELAEITSHFALRTSPLLMVGFNRRFSPLTLLLKSKLSNAPVAMLCRVNAGAIPAEHWIQDADFGGGRIVGEACHFIDLLTFFAGSVPKTVFASALPDAKPLADSVAINLEFENGSVGAVMYYANGCKTMPKEHLEVYQAGQTGVIEDFRRLTVWGGGSPLTKRLWNQDKGQKEMIRQFLAVVKVGGPPPIPVAEILAVTRATFAVGQSLRSRQPVNLIAS